MLKFNKIFLILISLFTGCENEEQSIQEIITFIKDVYPENDYDYKVAVKPTIDRGYIIAGCKNDSAWLMKTDPYGNKTWESTYGLIDYWGNRSVFQTSDGGFLFAGWTGLLKVNKNGDEEWITKGVEGVVSKYPYYEDIIEHSNGNYYAIGGPVTPNNNANNGGVAIFTPIAPHELDRKKIDT